MHIVRSPRRSGWHSLLLITALALPRSVMGQSESTRSLSPAAAARAPAAGAASAATAASASTSESASQARARFDAGVAAFDQGRFRDAVELFKEADRLAPSPRLSFNIAKVYERMGDNRGALAAYRDYLRRLPSADNAAEVSRRIAELEQSLVVLGVQQLRVSSTPEGAALWIDQVSRGVTPWVGELAPGPHAVVVRASGYRDAQLDFELPAQRAIDVDVPLASGAVAAALPPAGGLTASAGATAPSATGAAGAGERAPAGDEAAVAATPAASAGVSARGSAQPEALEGIPGPSVWTWTIWGASALALAGAGVFEIARGAAEDDARGTPYQIDYRERFEAMQHRQTAARVCLGVGIVGALAGGASYWLDVRRARATQVALACDRDGCDLRAGGVF